MVFSSAVFLFCFLPLTVMLYFLTGDRYRNGLLFLASLLFYAWGEPVYVGLMILSTVVDYICGFGADRFRGEGRAKLFLWTSVAVNLSLLGFFKYYGAYAGIALPIGISFYTFQTMSYTIDVYRGDAPVQRNIISLGAYVALFPQLIAGPIVRYQTVAEQLNERRTTLETFGQGMSRFLVGLGKKVLLANGIGALWSEIQEQAQLSQATLLQIDALQTVVPGIRPCLRLPPGLGITAFAFQIYFDFSGYSDMAIGLGKIFGFDFPENFNYPYISRSVSEFWRRWHMSLGAWFKDYVYIPLGGSRKGAGRTVLNLAVVWLLTGVWHGASWNFLLWGVYFGVFIVLEKLFLLRALQRMEGLAGKAVQHVYLLMVVLLGWVLFAFDDMSLGLHYLKIMAAAGETQMVDQSFLFYLRNYGGLLILCAFASTPVWRRGFTEKRLAAWDEGSLFRGFAVMAALAVLLLSTASLISSSFNPFLYFRF